MRFEPEPQAVVQPRCLWPDCGAKHLVIAVAAISCGIESCRTCKRPTAAMTAEQMLSIRRTNISMAQKPYTCTSCEDRTDDFSDLLQHLREKHPIIDA